MTLMRQSQPPDDIGIFHAEPVDMTTPAARRALQTGLLASKGKALRNAERLARWGSWLVIAIIAVSFVHLWDTIAAIKPDFVPELRLPVIVFHLTAAALVLAVDLAAFYVVAAGRATLMAGGSYKKASAFFFLLTTFLLNASFIVRYAPELWGGFREGVLPWFNGAFIILIPAVVPVGIFSIEGATTRLETSILKLLVETTALRELLNPPAKAPIKERAPSTHKASQCDMGTLADNLHDGAGGGREREYTVGYLLEVVGESETIQRRDARAVLGCSESTIDRLLDEAVEAGCLTRLGRGAYTVIKGAPDGGS